MMMVIREWMIDHLEIESTVLHKESEEAQIQMQREGANKLGEHLHSVCKILGGIVCKIFTPESQLLIFLFNET